MSRWVALLPTLLALALPAGAADVIVGTPPFNPDPGEQFTIDISVDVGSDVLAGYILDFVYDPAVVNVVSIGGGTTPQFAAAPITDVTSFASGATPLAAAQGNMSSPTGVVNVATVTLQAVGLAGTGSDLDCVIDSLVETHGVELPASVFASSVLIGFDPALDPDGDGLTNDQELAAGTDLQNPDTDGDGLEDGFEVLGGLDPLDDGSTDADHGAAGDPDGDTLLNLTEQTEGCSPTSADTDSDGLDDDTEVALGTSCSLSDSDGDGLGDGFEVGGGLDPLDDGSGDPSNGAAGDPDGDTLSNADEQNAGTDPGLADTDGDGLPDDFEVNGGLDPNDDGSVDPDQGPGGDPDGDGLSNADELGAGTNPTDADTDGDGLPDDYELDNGLDPNDDGSVDPDQGAAGDLDGDGGSNAEEFELGSDPQDPRSRPVNLEIELSAGFQPLFYALDFPVDFSAFELLDIIGPDEEDEGNKITAVSGLPGAIDPVRTATLGKFADAPAGDDFPMAVGSGVLASVATPNPQKFMGAVSCAPVDLLTGVNVVGFVCTPPGYTAFALLADLGGEAAVAGVQRFDMATGRFETATFSGGLQAGSDFPIRLGEAYLIHMRVNLPAFDPVP